MEESIDKEKLSNALNLVQRDLYIRDELAKIVHGTIKKYDLVGKDISEKADIVQSYLSAVTRGTRGISTINSIKLIRAFPIAPRLEVVLKVVFPEIEFFGEDLKHLADFVDEARKETALRKSRRQDLGRRDS
jgi:predicted XRE-type DNA-binding protein